MTTVFSDLSVLGVRYSADVGRQTSLLALAGGVHLRCAESLPGHHQPVPLHPHHRWCLKKLIRSRSPQTTERGSDSNYCTRR